MFGLRRTITTARKSSNLPSVAINLDSYVANLPEGSPEVTNIRIAWHTYPDLALIRDAHKRVCYCSRWSHPSLTEVEMSHDRKGRLLAHVWKVEKGLRIYANPPEIPVGIHNTTGFGEIPDVDWEEFVEHLGLDRSIVLKIRDYFRAHARADWT